MILLAAYSVLRIMKSPLKEHVNWQKGEQSYFKAIALVKKRSIQNNDLDARNGIIMTQLWSSNNVFKRANGCIDGLILDVRSRLVKASQNYLMSLPSTDAVAVHERRL